MDWLFKWFIHVHWCSYWNIRQDSRLFICINDYCTCVLMILEMPSFRKCPIVHSQWGWVDWLLRFLTKIWKRSSCSIDFKSWVISYIFSILSRRRTWKSSYLLYSSLLIWVCVILLCSISHNFSFHQVIIIILRE